MAHGGHRVRPRRAGGSVRALRLTGQVSEEHDIEKASMDRAALIAVARGDAPADLRLANARVVNVLTGEIVAGDVAVAGDRIAGLGDYAARETIDLDGAFLAPGFIDAHVHIESSMVSPRQFARAVVPRGTTTVVCDPHEIANVAGLGGVRYMRADAADGPLDVRVMASSCVPATPMATSGASLAAADIAGLAAEPDVPGLAEMMNYPGVVMADPGVLAKLEAFADRVIDGHAPGLSGKALGAYVAAGIGSDHECTTAAEAIEKARLGMQVFIREATGARNLSALVPVVNAANADCFCLCTDDRHPADLLDDGHIDHLVRLAIDAGLDAVTAIRLATWNPARYFRLTDRGAIAPGRRADMIAFRDLEAPRPHRVFAGGRMVASDGRLVAESASDGARTAPPPLGTMRVAWDRVDLRVPAAGGRLRAIGIVPDQIVTAAVVLPATIRDGCAVSDPERDLLKLAVIERHGASGSVGLGFVQGLALRRGALASSVAHDHHNIVCVGADDTSMRAAAVRVADLGGGLVVADGATIRAEVPLPIAGLMSDRPIEEVRAAVDAASAAARRLGAAVRDPFATLSFLALEVIPHLKLTDRGLVDVDRFAIVPLWVD
jgi:adenine deaminase